MFDSDVGGYDAAAVLAELDRARTVAAAAEVQILRMAAQWADLHAVLDRAPGPVLPGAERLVAVGGVGTPAVAEFCLAELGVELATSTHAARVLVADALDLRHRLPVLWARTQAGEVKPWMARKTAQTTRHLTQELAAAIDAAVTPFADRISWGRLEGLILATWKRLDPAGANEAEHAARTDLGVWLNRSSEHGTKSLFLRLEAPDAIRFDAAVQRGADALEALGDTRGDDQRRAAAVGVLADPQDALDLYTAHAHIADDHDEPDCGTTDADSDDEAAADPACVPPPALPRPGRRELDTGPQITLYVHLSEDAVRTGIGVARVEDVGPVTAGLVRDWLAHANVTVRPVIDLNSMTPVDGYEIPTRIAEAVRLRSPIDCFPYATATRRGLDLDHTEPYRDPDDGGPPGQTRQDNLAPLTRAHHRVKTHGHWQVRQVYDGVLVWRSPRGRHYLVDHTGTTRAQAA